MKTHEIPKFSICGVTEKVPAGAWKGMTQGRRAQLEWGVQEPGMAGLWHVNYRIMGTQLGQDGRGPRCGLECPDLEPGPCWEECPMTHQMLPGPSMSTTDYK